MNITNLYVDFFELLGKYLDSDDLFAFMISCKFAYKACKRHSLKIRLSYPMSLPWRLTYEQRSVIKAMENKPSQQFKLIQAPIGAGKTIVSIAYAIRNYITDPNAKIVMCGPPSLIKMWWTTLEKYFNIKPYVLHTTNTEYRSNKSWLEAPKEKFILVSYILLSRHGYLNWFNNNRDLLIVDECHHQTGAPYGKFKEVLGLSATTTKKSGLTRGIKHIFHNLDFIDPNNDIEEFTYYLGKDIISESLPPVKYYPYDTPISPELSALCKTKIVYTRKGDQDITVIQDICKWISHPEILSLRDTFTGGYIMVGRKKFRVDDGNNQSFRIENPNSPVTYKNATFDITKFGRNYPKYIQTYHIIKQAFAKGEKILIFDSSVTYLPFLHKFLTEYGINSYIFSTHYDVTGRQRQLSKFKEDKKPAVLLSSIAMLGEGQNVTEANHVIFFSHYLDHTKYYQAIGRCWRYPQKKNVHIHLIFGGEFERKVYEHACGATDILEHDWVNLL